MAVELLEIEPIHEGKFLKFYNFKLSDGRTYEVISRRDLTMENVNTFSADAVDIIAFSPDRQKILVIKEWRIPVNDYIYAFPAGLRESNEGIFETARRELYEETGLHIETLYDILPPAYQSAGMTNEVVASVFCSADGELTNANSMSDEDIVPMWLSKADALELLSHGKFSARCQLVLSLWANEASLGRF